MDLADRLYNNVFYQHNKAGVKATGCSHTSPQLIQGKQLGRSSSFREIPSRQFNTAISLSVMQNSAVPAKASLPRLNLYLNCWTGA